MDCPLCALDENDIVWRDEYCCVIPADDPDYPGYYRVVWNAHVTEMSDLSADERRHLMDVALAVECSLRALMNPDKINLASLGNKVPHLHWHVIPRFTGDRHFPESIWGHEQRSAWPDDAPDHEAMSDRITAELARISVTC